MQRSARAFGFPLLVEAIRNGQSIRIEFDHAVYSRTAPVDLFDPRQYISRSSEWQVNFPEAMPACRSADGESRQVPKAATSGAAGVNGGDLAGPGQSRQHTPHLLRQARVSCRKRRRGETVVSRNVFSGLRKAGLLGTRINGSGIIGDPSNDLVGQYDLQVESFLSELCGFLGDLCG